MNWRHGPLLRTVGEHDLFLVTSNSSSFGVWWPFIQGELQLTDMTVVGPLVTFGHRPGGQSFSSSDTGLHFNLAAFPTYSDGKHGTSLVQQWQLERCRRLIERREAARGAPICPGRTCAHRRLVWKPLFWDSSDESLKGT